MEFCAEPRLDINRDEVGVEETAPGKTLECDKMINSETGIIQDYEEFWRELSVLALGEDRGSVGAPSTGELSADDAASMLEPSIRETDVGMASTEKPAIHPHTGLNQISVCLSPFISNLSHCITPYHLNNSLVRAKFCSSQYIPELNRSLR